MHNINDYLGKYTVVLLCGGGFAVDNENGTYTIYAPNQNPYKKVANLITLED